MLSQFWETSAVYVEWIHPSNATVKEGDSVYLTCTLRLKIPYISVDMQWTNGFKPYQSKADNSTVIRTSSDALKLAATSELRLQVVSRSDHGFYKCSAMIIINHDTPYHTSSRYATLNVQYFLKDKDITCTGPVGAVFRQGDPVDTRCETPLTNPKVHLAFILLSVENQGSSVPFTREDNDEGQAITAQLVADRRLHNKIIRCVASSSAFLKKTITCSMGPFHVLHSPYVKVVPERRTLLPPLISQIAVNCFASAYPVITSYQWSCNPSRYVSNCSSNDKTLILILKNASLTPNSLFEVKCSVENDMGKGENNTHIIISSPEKESLPSCQNRLPYKNEFVSTDKESFIITYGNYNEVCTLQCSFISSSFIPSAQLRWYINGMKIENDVERSSKDLTYRGFWRLVNRQNINEMNVSQTIACELTSPSESLLVACVFEGKGVNNSTKKLQTTDTLFPTKVASTTEEGIRQNPTDVKENDVGGNNIWGFMWVVVAAVIVGFVLLACAVILTLAVQKLWNGQRGSHSLDVSKGLSFPAPPLPPPKDNYEKSLRRQEMCIPVYFQPEEDYIYEIPDVREITKRPGRRSIISGEYDDTVVISGERKMYNDKAFINTTDNVVFSKALDLSVVQLKKTENSDISTGLELHLPHIYDNGEVELTAYGSCDGKESSPNTKVEMIPNNRERPEVKHTYFSPDSI